jgi:xanthine/uracil permease
MTGNQSGRGIGDLLGDLGRQVSTLVRREIDLARVELTSSIRQMGTAAGMTAIGGAVAYAGVLVLLLAAVLGLIAAGVEPWLAALIVAVVVLAIGAALVSVGMNRMKGTDLAPKQTVETVRENVEFVKEQMK